MSNPTWVYHHTEKAKIVEADEAEKLFKSGWSDTPNPEKPKRGRPKKVDGNDNQNG